MNNKLKIILIAVEVFALVVLLLLGVGCQQRWIIVTGDGPRFDWYTVKEDLVPNLGSLLKPADKEKETEPSEEPTSEPEITEPPTTEPPATTRPPETTAPPVTTEPEETEEPTEPDETTSDDRWSLGEF